MLCRQKQPKWLSKRESILRRAVSYNTFLLLCLFSAPLPLHQHSQIRKEQLTLYGWLLLSAILLLIAVFSTTKIKSTRLELSAPSSNGAMNTDRTRVETPTILSTVTPPKKLYKNTTGISQPELNVRNMYGKVLLRPDYSDSDFRHADARYAHFQRADFTRANAQSANFYQAFLGDAKFNNALLMHASLRVADLRRAQFLDADMSFSDLGDSKSTDAVFSGAVLRYANVSRANLIGAQFNYANLYSANLQKSWLLKASLRGAVLADARLDNTNLQYVDFTYADFNGANLSGADLRHSNISKKQLADACGNERTRLPEAHRKIAMRAC